ncbi:MAG TPA: hypothetical protein DCP08_09005 [Chloroflexi bacterium]|nr:hypothetical protein [Chloroflexota bacterium]
MEREKGIALALSLFLLAIYLLTYSGDIHSSDGLSMLSVTESLVKRGDYDTNQILWMGLQQGTFGRGGELYSRKGMGTSLVALPLAWLGLIVPFWGFVQTTLLLNVAVTALSGLLVFLYLRRLGYSWEVGLLMALLFGLGTMAWPYSKYFFSEPLTGLALLAAAYFLLRFRETQTTRDLALAGTSLGLAIATRLATAAIAPLFLLPLLAYSLPDRVSYRRLIPFLAAFLIPLILWGLLIGGYNYLRFENPLVTGYLPEESFRAPLLTGLAGLLISPGRGLFLYCPLFLALFPSFPVFLRRHRPEGLFCLSLTTIHILLYSKWFMWHGGHAWGPRFLVPIIPFLVIPLAPLVEGLRGRAKATFASLSAITIAIQILGLSVHFADFQEILVQAGLPLYAPVTFFHPRYSPLLGQLSLLRTEYLDFAWMKPNIDWLVLALLLSAALISALTLAYYAKATRPYATWPLMAMTLLIVGLIGFTLARYKQDGHRDFVEMVEFITSYSQPNDALVFNSPAETSLLQNHYKGNLPLYGLFEGGPPLPPEREELLQTLTARYRRLWLIPGGLNDGLDIWLSEKGYRAFDKPFGEERLALYFFPSQPLAIRPMEAIFGEKIALVGYGFQEMVQPGDVLPLNLHWKALKPMEEDYHVFVHLVDEEGRLWTQQDSYPLLGAYPTSRWQPGEEISDKYALLLPLEMPPGEYQLLVGFYLLESGHRLILADGENYLPLGLVQVPRGCY